MIKKADIADSCALLNNDYTYKPREEHHVVFGSGQRESSEKYGLKVYLCPEHHRGGPYAPHNNKEIRKRSAKSQESGLKKIMKI